MGGDRLDAAEVEEASMAWAWVPDNAIEVRPPGLRVVAYPPHFEFATAVSVAAAADDDPAHLVASAHVAVRDLGRDRAFWYVVDHTLPTGLEDHLLGLGAEVVERTDVLAVPLPAPPWRAGRDGVEHVEVVEVADLASLRDVHGVESAAFGTTVPPEDQMTHALGELQRGRERGDQGRFLARVDGQPVGSAGWTLAAHGVLRLWAAGTVPEARRRGVYGALLRARLEVGAGLGGRMALSHGRIATSSPILQRAGFTRYGEKRVLALDLEPS